MRKSIFLSALIALALGILPCAGSPVQIKMNRTSTTMTLMSEEGSPVDIGEPTDRVYSFDATPGNYILTGIDNNGNNNGTIAVKILDQSELQTFDIFTQTIYATNRDAEGNDWQYGVDYTAEVKVVSREGENQVITIGDSSEKGHKSALAFSGNTVYLTLIPSEVHVAEGYMDKTMSRTITSNTLMAAIISKGCNYTITLPSDANVEIGSKGSHFTEFSIFEPIRIDDNGDTKTIVYFLPENLKLNIRTWKKDGLTQAFHFYPSGGPKTFTTEDYTSYNPKQVNHDVNSNNGYETGDIFVNINERGHLTMNVGDEFDAHAMRTWQLTDTQIDNYFFEPDFHYTIIDLDGKPSTGVIEVSTDETTSPWRRIRAVGKGSAIVLVTYDAIRTQSGWMGGEYWGAIWPENTAAYVVTVGESSYAIEPNMVVNEKYNVGEDGKALLKLAGKNVDAEHDVFYYLDTEDGYNFTFKPTGVTSVTLAYPTIGENAATYTGFGSEGVTANADGSYTLLLKHGRQIVKMTDASGKSVYQVLTAKACHREIINETRKGSDKFYPGDKIKIQYSGMFHPANKLAGIYNMSAYVIYNGKPNGTSLILGAGQYTFGSAPKAQAVEFEIDEDYDAEANPDYVFSEGVIQVNGYGDPIGNHRNIDRNAGRSPNFTAMAHKTYFGAIPDVTIPISARKRFNIKVNCNAENPLIYLSKDDVEKKADSNGLYHGVSGNYTITVSADNHRCYRGAFELTDEMDPDFVYDVEMVYAQNCWNGSDKTEPAQLDGVYQISNGAELAWFAECINNNGENQNAELTSDIDLGDYQWPLIGESRSVPFHGKFNGNGHLVSHLYYVAPNSYYYGGLFGALGSADGDNLIENLRVDGYLSSTSYIGGIVGRINYGTVKNCVNYAKIEAQSTAGGIAGYGDNDAVFMNCINHGEIIAEAACAGIVGFNYPGLKVENALNVGIIKYDERGGPCIVEGWPSGSGKETTDVANLFAVENKQLNWTVGMKVFDGTEIVSTEQLASGEVAYRLGEAFGQTIGEESYPVLNGAKVYKVNYTILSGTDGTVNVLDGSETALYINGTLPAELNGEKVHWFMDAEMTQPVTSVETDVILYAKVGELSGIDNIGTDSVDAGIRWFNLQGFEVLAPEAGTHGVFIRVINGRGEKVVL